MRRATVCSAIASRAMLAIASRAMLAIALICTLPLHAIFATPMHAQEHASETVLDQAVLTERLGNRVPGAIVFRDLSDRETTLTQHLAGSVPVILVPADYDCRMLCPLLLDALARQLRETRLAPGTDYRVVVFGIDPRDAADVARSTAARIGAPGWSFLRGDSAAIRALTGAVGFGFRFDPKTDQYAHPMAAVVLTPDGRVSSYLYGIEIPPRALRRAIATATAGTTFTGFERVLLRCYQYFPALRRYEWLIRGILTTGGLLTISFMATLLGWSLRRQHAKAKARA